MTSIGRSPSNLPATSAWRERFGPASGCDEAQGERDGAGDADDEGRGHCRERVADPGVT
jgi:hypothetical protein